MEEEIFSFWLMVPVSRAVSRWGLRLARLPSNKLKDSFESLQSAFIYAEQIADFDNVVMVIFSTSDRTITRYILPWNDGKWLEFDANTNHYNKWLDSQRNTIRQKFDEFTKNGQNATYFKDKYPISARLPDF